MEHKKAITWEENWVSTLRELEPSLTDAQVGAIVDGMRSRFADRARVFRQNVIRDIEARERAVCGQERRIAQLDQLKNKLDEREQELARQEQMAPEVRWAERQIGDLWERSNLDRKLDANQVCRSVATIVAAVIAAGSKTTARTAGENAPEAVQQGPVDASPPTGPWAVEGPSDE